MNYTANGNRNRHFELLDATNTLLGKLAYPSLFARRVATIELAGKTYNIAPVGFWQTTIELKQNATTIAAMKFRLGRGIVITMENGTIYTFKRVGFFNYHFGVFTAHEQEIIKLKHNFEFLKFSSNYTMETDDNYTEGKDPLFLLLMVYCANFTQAMSSAAV